MIQIQNTLINISNVRYISKHDPVSGETASILYYRIYLSFVHGGDITFKYDTEVAMNTDFIKLRCT